MPINTPISMPSLIERVENAHEESIWSMSYCKSNELLLTGSLDETVRVWDTKNIGKDGPTNLTLENKIQGQHDSAVINVTSMENNSLIISNSMDSTVCVSDPISGSVVKKLELAMTSEIEAWSMAVSDRYHLIFLGSHHGLIHAINSQTFELDENTLFDTKGKFAMRLSVDPTGELLACGCDDGTVYIWGINDKRLINTLKGKYFIYIFSVLTYERPFQAC